MSKGTEDALKVLLWNAVKVSSVGPNSAKPRFASEPRAFQVVVLCFKSTSIIFERAGGALCSSRLMQGQVCAGSAVNGA